MAAYDRIGASYRAMRRPDPRIASQVRGALDGMDTVANVGAGAGSYEPSGTVVGIEPSMVMIAQRPAGSAPCVAGAAEALPLRDNSIDAVMAILTVHHWSDVAVGISELRRVARRRIVILTWDQAVTRDFWLLREYLPVAAEVSDALYVPVDHLGELLGRSEIQVVPVPHDCTDGFGAAYWRRPEAYLDAEVRAAISMLAYADRSALADGLGRLDADLRSGKWYDKHADLLGLSQLDVGYRLLITDLGRSDTAPNRTPL